MGGVDQTGVSGRGVPALRLVGGDAAFARRHDQPPVSALRPNARRDIARENHGAARLSESDARMVFAGEVARAIEGGRAGVLRPDRRRALVQRATGIGLRPFDAHLVIAIVQESAQRSGDAGRRAVIDGASPNLAMVGGGECGADAGRPTGDSSAGNTVRLAIIAIGIGLFVLGAFIAWLGA